MKISRRKVLKDRLARAERLVPAVLEFCKNHDVLVNQNDHGFQFRKAEYVLLWSPRTNKIVVQYKLRGHDRMAKFSSDSRQQKPKIMQALETLFEVSK